MRQAPPQQFQEAAMQKEQEANVEKLMEDEVPSPPAPAPPPEQ